MGRIVAQALSHVRHARCAPRPAGYIPETDVTESEDAIQIVMDMPGVARERIDIRLDKNVLTVEGLLDSDAYRAMRPLYSEYPLGHFSRSFTLSREIDQEGISATMADGVLSLRLPKAREAQARRITVA